MDHAVAHDHPCRVRIGLNRGTGCLGGICQKVSTGERASAVSGTRNTRCLYTLASPLSSVKT